MTGQGAPEMRAIITSAAPDGLSEGRRTFSPGCLAMDGALGPQRSQERSLGELYPLGHGTGPRGRETSCQASIRRSRAPSPRRVGVLFLLWRQVSQLAGFGWPAAQPAS